MDTKWNLELLFKNDEEIEKSRNEAIKETNKFVENWEKRTDYLEKPEVLKEALDDYNYWLASYSSDSKENYYYWLKLYLEQDNSELKAKSNKARDIGIDLYNKIQFFLLRIAKIKPDLQKLFLNNKDLETYRHFLENQFEHAKHDLSESEEKILTLKSSTAHLNWVQMLEEFLAKSQREVLNSEGMTEVQNFSSITSLMNDKNKPIRDSAAQAFNEIVKEYLDVAEHEFNSILQDKKTDDLLRKYERPDQSRHVEDDIETEVIDTLISTVADHYDIAQRYYALKAKLMGVTKLAYHERNVEYGSINKKYDYQEAVEIVDKVVNNLDSEFANIYHQFINQGRIDVYPQKGKQMGGFFIDDLPTDISYILLNFTGQLSDVTTLAHELGHGINGELIKKRQNAINFGVTKAVTEVASTFMEDFVLQELRKDADDEMKLSLLMMKLNEDISAIFRQTAFYNFEKEVHQKFREKGYLSKSEIGEIFQKHTSSYMGEAVSQDSGSENWWIYVSHFRFYFYVYSYVSGLLISKALQAEVKTDKEFIKKVINFLSTGLSESPKDTFLKLGIDITKKEFWEEGINEVEKTLQETEELAKKLGKI
jgi:oligoendopeptidase F